MSIANEIKTQISSQKQMFHSVWEITEVATKRNTRTNNFPVHQSKIYRTLEEPQPGLIKPSKTRLPNSNNTNRVENSFFLILLLRSNSIRQRVLPGATAVGGSSGRSSGGPPRRRCTGSVLGRGPPPPRPFRSGTPSGPKKIHSDPIKSFLEIALVELISPGGSGLYREEVSYKKK